MKVPRTRKQSAPRNVAAKALRQGQFQPKVEKAPKIYSRKPSTRTFRRLKKTGILTWGTGERPSYVTRIRLIMARKGRLA